MDNRDHVTQLTEIKELLIKQGDKLDAHGEKLGELKVQVKESGEKMNDRLTSLEHSRTWATGFAAAASLVVGATLAYLKSLITPK